MCQNEKQKARAVGRNCVMNDASSLLKISVWITDFDDTKNMHSRENIIFPFEIKM